jgi:hypothetical protein
MSTPSNTIRAARSVSTHYPSPASGHGWSTPNSRGDIDGDDDDAATNGWYDSSFDLRRGLEVIEWVLPDWVPGKPTPR